MPPLLSSPRRRRRLIVVGGMLALVGSGAGIILAFFNPAQPRERFTKAPVQQLSVSRTVPFTAARRRAVLAVLRQFAATAVARHNVASSFALVTSDLRAGMTRRQWASGDIPVSPFPEASGAVAIARLEGSYPNEVDVNVVLAPRPGTKAEPLGADVYLKRAGGRWLVDGFLPAQTLGAAAAAPRPQGKAARQPADPGIGPHLSLDWLLVPVGIFALILLLPLGIGIRDWLQWKRAERGHGSSRALPPLPRRKP